MKSLAKYEEPFRKVKEIYILCYVGYVLIARIVPLVNIISLGVNSVIYSALAIAGALIFAFDFLMHFTMFKSRENIILLIFCVVCVISSIINMDYGITSNVKTLVWMAIQFFVLFSIVNVRDSSEIDSTMTKIMKFTAAVWFIGVLVSVFEFLLQIGYVAPFDDFPRRQGFVEARLFGVFTDPNFAAVTSLMVILFCWMLLKTENKKPIRVYYYVNIALQLIYIVLSGSRTAKYGGLMLAFIVGLLCVRNRELGRDQIKLVLRSLLGGVVAVALSLAVIFVVKQTLPKMAELCNMISSTIQSEEDYDKMKKLRAAKLKEAEEISIERPDVTDENISNNRFKIWTNYIEASSDHRAFGLSPRNLMSFLKANDPDNYLVKRGYDETHNGWLAIFVCTGITGTLVMTAFFINYAYECCLYIKAKKKQAYDTKVIVLLGSVFVIAFSALLQPEIFFINTYGAITFWLFMGYLLYFMKQKTAKA